MTKVNSYFKEIHHPARRRAFELLSEKPRVEATKLIALKIVERWGDIVIKEVSTTQNLSPEKSVPLIKAWLGSILPKKEAELAAIAESIREFDPAAVSDTPMLEHDNKINQTISSQDFTAEKKRLHKTALRLRPEIWLLNHHWGFVCPQSGSFHVHCPPWNLITDIFYSSIPSMSCHAITDEHLNHASLPCAPNSRKRKDFEALLDSSRVEGDNGSCRRFEALRNSTQFVPLKLAMKSQYLPLANAAMQAHTDHLPVKPKYFFIKTVSPDQYGSIVTKKGFIRITKGTFSVNKSNYSPSNDIILTFEENIKYCSK